jgi:hypothetical protein
MFDVILDNYRKAAESTMKLQQDMLRNWTMQWPQMFGAHGFGFPMLGGSSSGSTLPGAEWPEQMRAFQKKWGETITEMLNKHRETLDAQYRAGIRTIENAFKVGEAEDPEQFRRLTEELWRQSFDCLKTVAETQMRDVQSAMQKWYEVASKTAAGVKV